MARKAVLIIDHDESSLAEMLEEFLDDTESTADKVCDPHQARDLITQKKHDYVFINPSLMSKPLAQTLKVHKQTIPEVNIFALSSDSSEAESFDYDQKILPSDDMSHFQKQILANIEFPEKLKVLVVDDELEIGNMIQDFLERRVKPSFEVRHAQDGQAGVDLFQSFKPDVLILDIKMPVKDGREVYREVQTKHGGVPTIVFFDAVAGHEIAEMRECGNPVIVEKGAPQSSLPELMQLIKKMYLFS